MHCQRGRKTPKTVPTPWDFITVLEEDRATAIGNMHRKIGKDRACDSGDMLANLQTQTDKQTDTQTNSSQNHLLIYDGSRAALDTHT